MQGLRQYSNDIVRLDLTPLSPTATTSSPAVPTNLSIDAEESAEAKIQRLISEHPVIIFSRSSCCMCHVMRKLLASIGVHPTVIELDDDEISALPIISPQEAEQPRNSAAPAVFIGGTCVGGLESLFALHLSGHLVPKLVEVGALWEFDDKEEEEKLEAQMGHLAACHKTTLRTGQRTWECVMARLVGYIRSPISVPIVGHCPSIYLVSSFLRCIK